jgi:benzoate 4-monooxygenase
MRQYQVMQCQRTIRSKVCHSTFHQPFSFTIGLTLRSLDQVIKETLRIHSTSSLGLPRQIPPGPGATIQNHYFPPGSVVSVPTYTIHHSHEIWGPDANEYDPERWSKERLTERQKNAFIPFSHGPRACVGRNVAEMELALTIATVVRRYEFLLEQEVLETREG